MARPLSKRRIERNGASIKLFEYDEAMQQHIYMGSITLNELFAWVKNRE